MQLTPEEIEEQQKNEENTKKNYITPIIQERWGKENLTRLRVRTDSNNLFWAYTKH